MCEPAAKVLTTGLWLFAGVALLCLAGTQACRAPSGPPAAQLDAPQGAVDEATLLAELAELEAAITALESGRDQLERSVEKLEAEVKEVERRRQQQSADPTRLAEARYPAPAGDATEDEEQARGFAIIRSDEPAQVYVNGKLVATTTPLRIELPAEEHSVRLYFVDRKKFSESRKVHVIEDQEVILEFAIEPAATTRRPAKPAKMKDPRAVPQQITRPTPP